MGTSRGEVAGALTLAVSPARMLWYLKETEMVRKTLIGLVFLIACGSTFSAWADCVYEGKSYPTGTKIGSLTCQADGTWR